MSEEYLERLRVKRERMKEYLGELREELYTARVALRKTENFNYLRRHGDNSSSDTASNTDLSEDNVPVLADYEEKLLNFYKLISGVNVTDIKVKPLVNKEKGDTGLSFQYNVEAVIEDLHFNISYISDKCMTLTGIDHSIDFPKIKELEIEMPNDILQAELKEFMEYFTSKPEYFGQLFVCLKSYIELARQRRTICRNIMTKYSDYIKLNLMRDTGAYHIYFVGKHSEVLFFKKQWSIFFNRSNNMMSNSFAFELNEHDDQLEKDCEPLFRQFSKCGNDEDGQTKRLEIIDKWITAIKDADTRHLPQQSEEDST